MGLQVKDTEEHRRRNEERIQQQAHIAREQEEHAQLQGNERHIRRAISMTSRRLEKRGQETSLEVLTCHAQGSSEETENIVLPTQSGPCIRVGLLCLVLCRTLSSQAHSAADTCSDTCARDTFTRLFHS